MKQLSYSKNANILNNFSARCTSERVRKCAPAHLILDNFFQLCSFLYTSCIELPEKAPPPFSFMIKATNF
jgi:hypothetical protein